jgi:hypothetical protein
LEKNKTLSTKRWLPCPISGDCQLVQDHGPDGGGHVRLQESKEATAYKQKKIINFILNLNLVG